MECSQLLNYSNDFTLHFYKLNFNDKFYPAIDFLESFRNFHSARFSEVEIEDCPGFFERHGPTVNNIIFSNCVMSERKLISILNELKNLQSLTLEDCKNLFMSGRLIEDFRRNAVCFDKLTFLSLANNRYLSDSIFNCLTSSAPLLNSLDLSGCHISFHKGLYKKFYPGNGNEASESVLTFHFISQFILNQADRIKSLYFDNTLIDGSALVTLSEASNLQLKVLSLKNCIQLTNDGILSLIRIQTNLQSLDLTQCVRFTDVSLYEICEVLQNLKSLKLRRCRALTDMGIKRLNELKNLKVILSE